MCFRILVSSILLLWSACSDPNADIKSISSIRASTGTQITPTYTEHFVLGQDESASPDEFFGKVRMVTSDLEGYIYVADVTAMKLKIFDSDGDFVKTIGKRGQGPGEMYEITCIVPDGKDEVVVIDSREGKVSRFSRKIGFVSSHKVEEHNPDNLLNYPRQGVQMKNGNYIFAYRSSFFSRRDIGREYLLHEVNNDLTLRTQSFMNMANIVDSKDSFEYKLASYIPGVFSLYGTDRIVYSPPFYDGKLYLFKKKEQAWLNDGYIYGKNSGLNAITRVSNDDYRTNVTRVKSDKTYSAIINSQSIGLHEISSGNLVHFSFIRDDSDLMNIQVEVFNPQGELVNTSLLDGFQLDGGYSASPYDIKWKDDRGRFYMVDKRSVHLIRVFSLNYSQ